MAYGLDAKLPMRAATGESLKRWLNADAIAAGSYLPSERELAKKFGTSRVSVRQALEDLESEGWIERERHKRPRVSAKRNVLLDAEAPRPKAAKDLDKVGMLIHSESDAYALIAIRGVHEVAPTLNATLQLGWIKDLGESALKEAAAMEDAGCGSLIVPWFPQARAGEMAELIRNAPLPVSIPLLIPGVERSCFEKPELFGRRTKVQTEAAFSYLRRLGHERIALLGPDSDGNAIMHRQLMAYTSCVCREGLQSLCGLPGQKASDMDSLAQAWSKYKGDLAVISYDDSHAIRFMTAMHKLGLKAPSDFAIIGCNDTQECRFSDPPLTSYAVDYLYCGKSLLKNALAMARGGSEQSTEISSGRLVVRASCGGAGKLDEAMKAELAKIGTLFVESD